MTAMADWKVPLPPAVREPYDVFINGVRQQPGTDYEIRGRELIFDRPLAKEGRLGFWRWFLGAWGIGTYRKNGPGRHHLAGRRPPARGPRARHPAAGRVTRPILFFDVGSPFVYLAAERVERALGVEPVWQPVLVGGLLELHRPLVVGARGRRAAGRRDPRHRAARRALRGCRRSAGRTPGQATI